MAISSRQSMRYVQAVEYPNVFPTTVRGHHKLHFTVSTEVSKIRPLNFPTIRLRLRWEGDDGTCRLLFTEKGGGWI